MCDNAGGIPEIAGQGEAVRHRTNALDASGNTTAPVGKGFCHRISCSRIARSLRCICCANSRRGLDTEVKTLQPLTFAFLYGWFNVALLVLSHDKEVSWESGNENGPGG